MFAVTLILSSAAVFTATPIAVLAVAVTIGTIPQDLVPVPLCWAGSAGPPKVIFSIGLMISGLLLAFAVPTLCHAYASLLDLEEAHNHYSRAEGWLVLFSRLMMSGLVLLAAVPYNREAADHLRTMRNLDFSKSYGDYVHGFGAFIFFTFAACFCIIVVAILMLADREDLWVPYMFWSKLSSPIIGLAMTNLLLRMRRSPPLDRTSPVIPGCAQFGVLCTMVVFLILSSIDLHIICFHDSQVCSTADSESGAVDWFSWMLIVAILLYAFACAAWCCTVALASRICHLYRASRGEELLQ